jgi:hypothetical protein
LSLPGPQKKVNVIDCLDHVWRYCDRISDDLKLTEAGVILRHQRTGKKKGKGGPRKSSIKPKGQKRGAQHRSRSSSRDKKRVRFAFNDGRKFDTQSELDGAAEMRCASVVCMCFCVN